MSTSWISMVSKLTFAMSRRLLCHDVILIFHRIKEILSSKAREKVKKKSQGEIYLSFMQSTLIFAVRKFFLLSFRITI